MPIAQQPVRWRLLATLLPILLAFCVMSALQNWIGSITIYARALEPSRQVLHDSILHNAPPPGATWESIGARSTNLRIAIVVIAQTLQTVTGAALPAIYFAIDSTCLFIFLLLLWHLLNTWFGPLLALIGWLYVAAVLPLTYLFHYFHPWDRISQLLWVGLIMALRRRSFVAFALMLGCAVLAKFDAVMAPALYWLAHRHPSGVSRKLLLQTSVLFAISLGLFGLLLLHAAVPGGPAGAKALSLGIVETLRLNVWNAVEMNWAYPPILMHALPALLAAIGWSASDQAARAAAIFSVIYFVPSWLLGSNFHEVRAQ